MLDSAPHRFAQRRTRITNGGFQSPRIGFGKVDGRQSNCLVSERLLDGILLAAWRRFLRCFAAALFGVYLVWNIFWISQLQAAPSIFESITGLPCATTGGTRSFVAAVNGDWHTSLFQNPMTVPILALLIGSFGFIAAKALRGQRIVLPQWMLCAFLVVLSVAWCYKIIQWILFGIV